MFHLNKLRHRLYSYSSMIFYDLDCICRTLVEQIQSWLNFNIGYKYNTTLVEQIQLWLYITTLVVQILLGCKKKFCNLGSTISTLVVKLQPRLYSTE